MVMPAQKPGKSEQSVATPNEFLQAVKNLLGIGDFSWDLAADEKNAVCWHGKSHFNEVDNSLIQPWHCIQGWLWLNPPYSDIQPWVDKAYVESCKGARIAMLVPASVGSNWWTNHVAGIAQVYFLKGRITFVGHKSPYPKDLALLLYRPNVLGGYSTWDWKKELTKP